MAVSLLPIEDSYIPAPPAFGYFISLCLWLLRMNMAQSSFDVAATGEKRFEAFWPSGAAVLGLLGVLLEP